MLPSSGGQLSSFDCIGTSYLQTSPDIDQIYQTSQITNGPKSTYQIYFTDPATYTVWLRGYASNAAGDSACLTWSQAFSPSQSPPALSLSGLAPRHWSWANLNPATLSITATGLYNLNLWMRDACVD